MLMADSDEYGFVRWAVTRGKFRVGGSSLRIANYLMARANMTGHSHEVHVVYAGGVVANVLSTYDIYSLLREAEKDVWLEYCAWVEEGEEHQARLDNARGKRY
jgi:hypothetical protein